VGANGPDLAVFVNFFNMRREAPRTLFTLTPGYQHGAEEINYEIVAIDNGSSKPLDLAMIQNVCGDRCRYISVETESRSPAAAINSAVRQSSAEWVMCLIDGARMVSPGVLHMAMLAAKAFERPFVYTLSMHLGHKLQNAAMLEGYDQAVEDDLLSTVDWRPNGYSLFDISCTAASSGNGFFSKLTETNCFCMRREDYIHLGGFSEEFQLSGGGLVNLDFFNRVNECDGLVPIMLLGEASFHQFHGGAATNVPVKEHPWPAFAEEYRRIRGRDYQSSWRPPIYLGNLSEESRRLTHDAAGRSQWRLSRFKRFIKAAAALERS
jgi:hypothetical protein